MSFTKITTTQTKFLESYLRGTGKTLSAAQAQSLYGIKNLRARMSNMRSVGLRVRTDLNTAGRTVYAISARDIVGGRQAKFV